MTYFKYYVWDILRETIFDIILPVYNTYLKNHLVFGVCSTTVNIYSVRLTLQKYWRSTL